MPDGKEATYGTEGLLPQVQLVGVYLGEPTIPQGQGNSERVFVEGEANSSKGKEVARGTSIMSKVHGMVQ